MIYLKQITSQEALSDQDLGRAFNLGFTLVQVKKDGGIHTPDNPRFYRSGEIEITPGTNHGVRKSDGAPVKILGN